jgi:hypothetical protein
MGYQSVDEKSWSSGVSARRRRAQGVMLCCGGLLGCKREDAGRKVWCGERFYIACRCALPLPGLRSTFIWAAIGY